MLLIWILLLPLAGSLLLPLLRLPDRSRPRNGLLTAVTLATSGLILLALIRGDALALNLGELLPGLSLAFRADGLSRVFLGLIALLWPLATLYAFAYMEHEERPNGFFAWYLLSYPVTVGVACAANLFTLFCCYECLTLVTLPLVWHKGDARSVAAARKYALFVFGGAALGFIALVGMIRLNATDFVSGGALAAETIAGRETGLRWLYLLAFLGFGVKAAVLPFSPWLPAASAAPTPVTALLHAVAVVNAGAFSVLRVTYYSFGTELLFGTFAQTAALGLACATVLYCSAMAVKERHLKRRLAWSTASNLGYMLLGAALMTPAGFVGALSHLVMHGLMKIVLFFAAGAILVQSGREWVSEVRGFAKPMPFTCACFTLAAVALVGIPPLAGFVSKWNLLEAAVATGLPMGIVGVCALLISSVLTAIYALTVVGGFYFQPLREEDALWGASRQDPDWRMKLPLGIICAAIVALGCWSEPLITYFRGIL